MNKIAIFPGSFDPITKGHESIVLKALNIFNKIIIAVGYNSEKRYMFTLQQRIQLVKNVFNNNTKTIEVIAFNTLTIDVCKKYDAKFIIRGLRNASDFDFERNIAHSNKLLDNTIETIFFLTDIQYSNITSSIVREIISNNGNVDKFVPQAANIAEVIKNI